LRVERGLRAGRFGPLSPDEGLSIQIEVQSGERVRVRGSTTRSILPPHPTPLRIFPRENKWLFVAAFARTRADLTKPTRILGNAATKVLNGVG
jgi:hypothetical protein